MTTAQDARSVENEPSSASAPDLEPPEFEDDVSRRIWENYIDRVETTLAPLQSDIRAELLRELKSHLIESIRHDEAEEESVRVLNATEKLGEPEEFLDPIVTDRLIEEGATTYNPLWVAKGLGRTLSRGIRAMVSGLLFGVGYLIVVALLGMAVLKPFFPRHVGLFHSRSGDDLKYVFAILDNPEGMTELLGYWVIPICLAAAGTLYVGLTKMLVLLRQSD